MDYLRLAQLLSRTSRQRRKSSLITFNYDIALDYALHHENCTPDYHLELEDNRRRGCALLKLHGSLNWASCSACGKIIAWHLDDYFRTYTFSPFDDDEANVMIPIASQLGDGKLSCCGQSVKSAPVIIPPTWNKTQYHTTIARVWQRAALELSDAENIFVVGYSLPGADSFFRYLLALGLIGDVRIKRFWVFDVDQSGDVERRFKKLLGGDSIRRFQYFPGGFQDSVPILEREVFPEETK